MNFVLSMMYALWFFIACALYLPVCLVLAIISLVFDRQKHFLNRATSAAIYHMLLVSPGWKFKYEGLENLKGGPFILVCNHQSLADIVALSGLRPFTFRFVSKGSVFFVPLLGWIMKLKGDVAIHRGDVASTRNMIVCCSSLLKRGISVMMFPEGTRSPDGSVQSFKEGPFRLAKKTGVPVIPVAIVGTREILPKSSVRLSFKQDVTVRVLPPVSVADFDGDSGRLKDYVHACIKHQVESMRLAGVPVAERELVLKK